MGFIEGLAVVFLPQNIFLLVVGVVMGILIGAIPGLTSTLAISLLLPFTFGLEPATALNMLIGIYIGGVYGGAITAILIRTPGTPGAAATVLDGYPMAQRGEAGRAIGIATMGSFLGGIISAGFLIFFAPAISRFALNFSTAEYFALAVFGLTIVFSVAGKSLLKGAIAGLIGLLISTVGMDVITGSPRFTFGVSSLLMGFPLLPAVIGLFAICEVLRLFEGTARKGEAVTTKIGSILPTWKDFMLLKWTYLKAGVIGTFIGALPGPGPNIAAFVAYGEARRSSKNPENFGNGAIEGVAAPETSNNAVTGGCLIPMLTLGVPGDAVTAVILGALVIQGLTPGPMLFENHPELINAIFAGFVVSKVAMVIFGLMLAVLLVRISLVSKTTLAPIIAIMAMVGAYASESSMMHMQIAIAFGIGGYLLEKMGYPLAPIALAIVLGSLAENNFRLTLIRSGGEWGTFVHSAIAIIFLALAVFSLAFALHSGYKERQKGL
ncbi:MAG: tripartite tricarboxylate transporter permease [Defluviitaleaceae bacterium]|nr:tripartite tricarboxylate transporter permease [Defluviitaleaceae bacterium]